MSPFPISRWTFLLAASYPLWVRRGDELLAGGLKGELPLCPRPSVMCAAGLFAYTALAGASSTGEPAWSREQITRENYPQCVSTSRAGSRFSRASQ